MTPVSVGWKAHNLEVPAWNPPNPKTYSKTSRPNILRHPRNRTTSGICRTNHNDDDLSVLAFAESSIFQFS
jgi:hypothetical protein